MIRFFSAACCTLFFLFLGFPSSYAGGDPTDESTPDTMLHHRIVGQVKCDRQLVEDATVLLFNGNTLISTLPVDEHSNFELLLPGESNCTIEVRAQGYHPKRMAFDTHTSGEQAITFRFKVELIAEEATAHADAQTLSVLDFPCALIVYDSDERKFTEARQYAKHNRRFWENLMGNAFEDRFCSVDVKVGD